MPHPQLDIADVDFLKSVNLSNMAALHRERCPAL